jgi:hypothetical protein
MNLSATVDILNAMHDRICKIESVFEQRRSKSAFLNSQTVSRQVESATINSQSKSDKNYLEEWAQIVSNVINDKINEIIRKTYLKEKGYPLTEQKCQSILADIISAVLSHEISPVMKKEFGSKLKGYLTTIFSKEEWARGDRRETHKYVKITWNAMNALELW